MLNGKELEKNWNMKILRFWWLIGEINILILEKNVKKESFGYIILFILLYRLYNTTLRDKEGMLFGYFLIGLFSIRFIIEFVKESQGGIETYLPALSTGQWLSIPFIVVGLFFVLLKKKTN